MLKIAVVLIFLAGILPLTWVDMLILIFLQNVEKLYSVLGVRTLSDHFISSLYTLKSDRLAYTLIPEMVWVSFMVKLV